MSEVPHMPEKISEEALLRPVPDMTELRQRKQGYNDLPINKNHPLFEEPIVAIGDYGIAGQAYYSRPNAATGEAVPGVPKAMYLRRSVAETLADLNRRLLHPAITAFYGGEVELYAEDSLRPVSLQKKLHDELIPALLKKQNPHMNDQEVADRLKDMIAVPSSDPKRPSPHATGGVLDVTLRFRQPTKDHVEGSLIDMGHTDADTSDRIYPDYYEHHAQETEEDKVAQRNRRAYYAIMTGMAFGIETGLTCNPTEWWHWGRGDQLSAKVRGEPAAYYSLAEPKN